MEDVVAEALRDDGELVLEEPAAVACTSLAERIASNLSDVLPTVRVVLLKTPSRFRIIQELSECGLIEGVQMLDQSVDLCGGLIPQLVGLIIPV